MRRPALLLLVDDLDRCPEAFVVDLLDSVQKLMRDKLMRDNGRGGPNLTVLVVVAADGRWVRRSYDNAYASLAEAVDEPGATIGTLFLEKLFQMTVPVPRLPDELKDEYLSKLLADRSGGDRRHGADAAPERRLSRRPATRCSASSRMPVRAGSGRSEVAINKLVVESGAQESTQHALELVRQSSRPHARAMKRFGDGLQHAAGGTHRGGLGSRGRPARAVDHPTDPLADAGSYLQTTPDAVRLFDASAERVAAGVPTTLVPLFTDPPADLRAVMNHPDGPLDARRIAESSGQLLGDAGGP